MMINQPTVRSLIYLIAGTKSRSSGRALLIWPARFVAGQSSIMIMRRTDRAGSSSQYDPDRWK
ncbi:hypothetical protein CHU32_23940 [Superficieibacter electus]|uniref:Uncharacterized protein n=1 Tax=Superficieibacter electus TaxID=2022662 RepID=A0A2P5GIF5_9ENTR|nr:hypothetical protein CHU33_24390 [Superficieibacter electus]POP42914.1 hypothetical protein CHU32_23940 [Superficieibacter electus]